MNILFDTSKLYGKYTLVQPFQKLTLDTATEYSVINELVFKLIELKTDVKLYHMEILTG